MHILPNHYFKAKNIIKTDVDYRLEKNKGLLKESIIARLSLIVKLTTKIL